MGEKIAIIDLLKENLLLQLQKFLKAIRFKLQQTQKEAFLITFSYALIGMRLNKLPVHAFLPRQFLERAEIKLQNLLRY